MTKRLSFLMVFALLAMTPMAAAFDDTSKKAKGVDDNNEAAASEAEDDPKFLHWEEHYRATVIRTQVGEADIKLSTYRGLELKWRGFTAHVG